MKKIEQVIKGKYMKKVLTLFCEDLQTKQAYVSIYDFSELFIFHITCQRVFNTEGLMEYMDVLKQAAWEQEKIKFIYCMNMLEAKIYEKQTKKFLIIEP